MAFKGFKYSEESKKKMSESHKGCVFSIERKEKIRKSMLGKNTKKRTQREIFTKIFRSRLSEEDKEMIRRRKISQFRLGKKRPELTGNNNPMHTHPNSYKSKWGKAGYRKDIGIFVKSTWEANIARVFKLLHLYYQYEPESFRLLDGRTYRPDFFILDTGEIIEVKGYFRGDSKERMDCFKDEYPGIPFDLIDRDKYYEYEKEFKNLIPEWES